MNTRQELIDLTSQLVRIDSINPWLVEEGGGEAQVAQAIAEWLKPLGVEVWLDPVQDGRPNLLARWPGAGGGRSLCLYAHVDTVGCAPWREQALDPWVEGERLFGLGACDDKGHVAAAMLALKHLVEKGARLRGDLWLALLMDEEGESRGAFQFAERYKPDAMLVLEPFGLDKINITHQGFGWLDVIVYGKAAHGSAPEVGIDAILHMAEVITRLGRLDREVYAPTAHPLNGKTVFHTSLIQGGTDYATYPDRCVLGIEIGTQPGETIEARVREIEAIFKEVKALHPNFRGEVQVRLAREPFSASGHEPLWQALAEEIQACTGQAPRAAGENAWGDAAIFQEAGVPTLMIGALGQNLHAPGEWVHLPELEQLVGVLEGVIERYCN